MHKNSSIESTRTLTKMALCVALLAVSAYISFPLPFTPVMVTALTIIVNLTAFILKPGAAFLTLVAWMILGAVGVPVFVGGNAGAGRLFGPTGGFILSFAVAVWVMSYIVGQSTSFKRMALAGIVGMPIIYAGGCLSMYLVAHYSIQQTLACAVLPFIVGDVFKVFVAAFLGSHLKKVLNRSL